MSFFCASSLREVVPVEGAASSHVAVAARSATLREAIVFIVLVNFLADLSSVGWDLDDECCRRSTREQFLYLRPATQWPSAAYAFLARSLHLYVFHRNSLSPQNHFAFYTVLLWQHGDRAYTGVSSSPSFSMQPNRKRRTRGLQRQKSVDAYVAFRQPYIARRRCLTFVDFISLLFDWDRVYARFSDRDRTALQCLRSSLCTTQA